MKAFAELTRRGRRARLRQPARLALARYGLGTARISPLANHFNALFRLDDAGTRYVLRIGRAHGERWPTSGRRSGGSMRRDGKRTSSLQRRY